MTFVTNNSAINSPSVPPARFLIIIGAMKSGTTSLFEILGQHSEISPARVKEPDFFVTDRNESGLKDYLSLWDWHDYAGKYALESSVAYTKVPFVPGVPARIKKMGLGTYKFIYILRNPVTRIESQVRHGLFSGWGKSLDEEMTADLIAFSRYAMQIDEYLKYFDREDVALVVLEEFEQQPEKVLTRLCAELGIDTQFVFSDTKEQRNSGEFFNASPKIAYITQSGVGQFVARKVLPQRLKNWLRQIISRTGQSSSAVKDRSSGLGRWRLNEEEQKMVWNALSEDMNRLEAEFDLDVRRYWDVPPEYMKNSTAL